MDIAELQSTYSLVLWAAFGAALVFGFIAQRSHFCTMGAISDIVNMGDWTRMRMWGMAVGVAMIGFHLMAWLGWIDGSKTIYTGTRVIWLSAMGVAAFATLRGVLAVLRVNTVDQVAFEVEAGSALPAWVAQGLGWDVSSSGLILGLLIGGVLVIWALVGDGFRTTNNLLAGFGIGLVITLMWWVSGSLGFVEEHPETLESVYLATNTGRMESLTFTAPMAYTLDWIIFFSDSSKVLTLGVVTVFGVVAGAFVQALLGREFHWEGFRSTQDTALHLVGAVCMGVGGVTALGCTVGQGLSGLSTLSLISIIAVAGIVIGAILGFRFQIWLLERE
ncbi:MAG: YeeE/YedE family protein [Hydrogenophaga sp.]|nr:YeeE/YedE family protein [Hydrogenophaga sp.]